MPELVPHPASFVIVGMAGFFAAAAKTPFSTLVIVSEMTGDYNLLLPALWVVHHRLPAVRRAVALQLAGREPGAVAGPPGQLRPRGAGRPDGCPVADRASKIVAAAAGRPAADGDRPASTRLPASCCRSSTPRADSWA